MLHEEILQWSLLGILLLIFTPILGSYLAWIYTLKTDDSKNILVKTEHKIFSLLGLHNNTDMNWYQYARALLVFNAIGIVGLFILQIVQGYLPLNQSALKGVDIFLAFNTAVSFVTNTNWQSYSGESTLTHLTQMFGLGTQNFLSAAVGMSVAAALSRAFAAENSTTIGNFWSDMFRSVFYVLFPLSFLLALALVGQGVVQNFLSDTHLQSMYGHSQSIAFGPAASQVAIKQLGSNGGGFFGINSAHPFENPTPISNCLQLLAILFIPASFPFMFGKIVGHKKHGAALFSAMLLVFISFCAVGIIYEYSHNPTIGNLNALEGKEMRFGVVSSVLWSIATSATSNGSVNAMISSLSPVTSGLALLNILFGEVIFGGVGSGLYGMIVFVILSIFLSGLMVGRTPEYLGKKIEAFEIKNAVVAVLAPSIIILIFTAICLTLKSTSSGISQPGPHGLTEVLYAFSSAAGNNGSAFAGLAVNTAMYNSMLAVAMLLGRFLVIVPVLAIAGSVAAKKSLPPSNGTFPIDNAFFVFLLISVIVVVGALTFFPVLSLGPISETVLMLRGRVF